MPTENKTIGRQRLDRIIAANEFLRVIANCGRCFFRNKGAGHDAYLALNGCRNIVWLFDDYTGARINVMREGPWKGFSHGGHAEESGRIYRLVRTQREDDALRVFPATDG